MTPVTYQNISQAIIVIGLVLAAIGGYSAFYFGKKISDIKDAQDSTITKKLRNVIDRNFELQKKLKRIAVGIELKEEVHIESLKPFVFVLKLQCIGSGTMPTFICCNFYPCDENKLMIINGQTAPSTVLETAWTLNPEKVVRDIASHRGDKRKNFVSELPMDNYQNFNRAIDLDAQLIEFYISESLVESVHLMNFIVNDLIVERFDPAQIEKFPAKATINNIGVSIPEPVLLRLSKDILELPLIRFGKKGGDPKWVQRGFPDIQGSWKVDFENDLWRVNDFYQLK